MTGAGAGSDLHPLPRLSSGPRTGALSRDRRGTPPPPRRGGTGGSCRCVRYSAVHAIHVRQHGHILASDRDDHSGRPESPLCRTGSFADQIWVVSGDKRDDLRARPERTERVSPLARLRWRCGPATKTVAKKSIEQITIRNRGVRSLSPGRHAHFRLSCDNRPWRRVPVRPRQPRNRRRVPREGARARDRRCFAPRNDRNAPLGNGR